MHDEGAVKACFTLNPTTMVTNYIGIDMAAYSFVSAHPQPTGSFQTRSWPCRTPADLVPFINGLNADMDHCVVEATGPYHLRLVHALMQADVAVSVVNPLSVKRFSQVLANITKTDARDAVLIARYGQQFKPAAYRLPPAHQAQLGQRRMVINQLQEQRQALVNQQHVLSVQPQPDEFSQNLLTQQQLNLDDAIAQLQAQMGQLIAEHYQQAQQLLLSIPGFGPVTTSAFLEVLTGFVGWEEKGATKAFVKYLGLAPVIHQSGSSVRGGSHISRSGAPWLRQKLWMPACTLAMRLKADTVFKELYIRLRQKGKSFKEAIVAVIHKLVRVALGVLQSGQAFNPQLFLASKENLV